jgi:hypothetical protein
MIAIRDFIVFVVVVMESCTSNAKRAIRYRRVFAVASLQCRSHSRARRATRTPSAAHDVNATSTRSASRARPVVQRSQRFALPKVARALCNVVAIVSRSEAAHAADWDRAKRRASHDATTDRVRACSYRRGSTSRIERRQERALGMCERVAPASRLPNAAHRVRYAGLRGPHSSARLACFSPRLSNR